MSEPKHSPEETIENPDKIVQVLRQDYAEAVPPIADVVAEEEPKIGREGYRSLPRWVYQAITAVSILTLLFVISVVVLEAVTGNSGGETAVTNDLVTPYPTPVDEIFTAPEPTDWPTPATEWKTVPEPTNFPNPPTPTPIPEPGNN